MSTFDGNVVEFPDIRIDYFRLSSSQSKPPLAYFLSHVHSDHLVGLESCKSPFIYCSPATRDILLRLEKYPHRMNFAKGILETRTQTYRHLKNLLKAIPLETPTVIELAPGREIRVTLFDANHCVGAVMFLIEGDGKAVLYTGDIRSELWWVNSLTRHPLLIPYLPSPNSNKRLDCMYIDTTFVVTGREDPYKHFPSKAEGIQELLRSVAKYPQDTFFYFDSWTFGYEDVWQALSNFLGVRVHVDDYRSGLYRALANGTEPKAPEAVKLTGFYCGNHFQEGCLTTGQSRLHSCEKGTGCKIWNADFVRITPIISRHNGVEMAELGAGGGQGDLNQQHELEVGDAQLVGQLMALCTSKLQGQTQLLSGVLQMLTSVINDGVKSIALEDFVRTAKEGQEDPLMDLDELPLDKLVPALAKLVMNMKQKRRQTSGQSKACLQAERLRRLDELPKRITFPYSRHSSYDELCHLIEAFKPADIYPCTVDTANWDPVSSMNFLFGHLYNSPQLFRHDQTMFKKRVGHGNGETAVSQASSLARGFDNHATPNSPTHESFSKAKQQRPRTPLETTTDRSKTHATGGEDILTKSRKKLKITPNGDYWPPRGRKDIDHYSPSSGRNKLPLDSVSEEAPDFRDAPAQQGWPALTQIHVDRDTRLANRWQKMIVDATSQKQQCGEGWVSKKRGHNLQPSHYGRLSPPPALTPDAEDDTQTEVLGNGACNLQHPSLVTRRRTSEKASIPRSPLTPTETRLAFRQKAYSAAIGSEGHSWTDIGLVSIEGHQVKEEEL